ncbi:acyltransferase [Azorhizobium oxalatiphilum]|uniref:Acyltransferase n=1 Tax=Azorhizobium oxalatiphilum TaxID=980631 RepID=A0A917C8H3_9HYPH|nr:acyltransferase [Azorhizobium oxalatiphilum]GGF74841.1 acyltransferase [Azorhizobium oxalatiphilum]
MKADCLETGLVAGDVAVRKPQAVAAAAHPFDTRDNAFDLIRLVAALAVIYGHAFYLVRPTPARDPIAVLFPFTYSGALAVDVFFLISGIFVTRSFVVSRNPLAFAAKRMARIFPALALFGAVVAVLLALFATRAPLDFLLSPLPWVYASNTAVLKITYKIPGVFEANTLAGVISGSLWTLLAEFRLYVLVLVMGLLGALTIPARHILILGVIIAFAANGKFFEFVGDARVAPSVFMFLAGMASYVYRHTIPVTLLHVGTLLATTLMTSGEIHKLCFYAFVYALVIWLGCLRLPAALRIRNDYSYGIYLYAFPLQQIFALHLPDSGPYLNFALSAVAAICCAIPSWHLVEKPWIHSVHGAVAGRWPERRQWLYLGIPVLCFAVALIGTQFGSPAREAAYLRAQQVAAPAAP